MNCSKCKVNPKSVNNKITGKLNSWCLGCLRDNAKVYRKDKKEKYALITKIRRRKNKRILIDQYGGKCECCGEKQIEFLSVDHVFNNGANHRREMHEAYGNKHRAGNSIYKWLKANGYPKEGFRILCFNCNASHGFYNYCPHKEKRDWIPELPKI
jgi:hypothetical protein